MRVGVGLSGFLVLMDKDLHWVGKSSWDFRLKFGQMWMGF